MSSRPIRVELGRALLEEGGDRFAHVTGHRGEDLRAVLEVDGGLQAAGLEVGPHHLFGHPHAERAVGRDELGDLHGGVDHVAVGHDAADEAHRLGLGGIDEPAGQHHLERLRRAHESRQQPAHADVAARQADAHERHVELGRRGRHSHVATEGERQSSAGGGAVDGGDDRLRQGAHVRDELGDVLLRLHPRAHLTPALGVGRRTGAAQVEAGAEPAAGAREDDDAALAVVARPFEGAVQIGDQLVRHGVEALGTIHGEQRDRRREALGQDGGHGPSCPFRTRTGPASVGGVRQISRCWPWD